MKNIHFKIVVLFAMLLNAPHYYFLKDFAVYFFAILFLFSTFLSFMKENSIKGFLFDYAFWIFCSLIFFFSKQHNSWIWASLIYHKVIYILIGKAFLLLYSWFKFRKPIVPTSFFNKAWIISTLLFFLLAILDSKYAFSFFIFTGIASLVDSFITISRLREWRYNVPFSFCIKKEKVSAWVYVLMTLITITIFVFWA